MAKWVMVVDDDVTNIKMAGTILSKNNMRVTALKSGRAMLDYISENGTPDLILLDIKMPEMDGFEAFRLLRKLEAEKNFNETPVIFLTADDNTGTETRGFEIGVSDYIRKPFNPDVLIRRIDNVISTQNEMISLKTEASTDKLTGLLNKAATGTELDKLCSSVPGTLLMIDLDSFKLVNDIYGHEMGDKVLISFANIIKSAVPEGSGCGRIGGDEFVAFAKGVQTEEEVAEIAKILNDDLVASAKEMMGDDMSIPLGSSVGAIYAPKYGNSYSKLFKLADKCLYTVKKNGKHGYAIYSPDVFKDEDSDVMNIDTICEIMSERNIPDVALQLDSAAFAYAYRFAMRYFTRSKVNVAKALYTLDKPESVSDEEYAERCDEFADHLMSSLRKSDIITRVRFNQYFALMTDTREEFLERGIQKIKDEWDRTHPNMLNITYEADFTRNDGGVPFEGANAHVVIVDDDLMNIQFVEKHLDEFGINITGFLSGQEFLDYTNTLEKVPDLVLLDIKMPGMDGFEVYNKMKEIGGDLAKTEVIFLASDTSDGSEVKGLSLGAIDYIKKPLLPEILKLRINHTLELVRLRKKYRIVKQ